MDPTTIQSGYLPQSCLKLIKGGTRIATLGFFARQSPCFLALGVVIGLACPEKSKEKTHQIWNGLFNQESAEEEKNPEWSNSLYNFATTKLQPIVGATAVGFFALPTATIHISAFLAGVEFGASGCRIDRFGNSNEVLKKV